jgi:diguanylate cyclase (GGDEF)-like protein
MKPDMLFEMELILLVIFSVFIPVGIYLFLYRKIAVSRGTVIAFALLLIVVAGIDVVLLQSLSEKAKETGTLFDDQFFSGQLSLILYLLPAAFAGLGVNLLSHVLVSHLNEAEIVFDKEHRALGPRGESSPSITNRGQRSEHPSEPLVLVGSVLGVAIIFLLDLWTGTNIRLHVLYVFPLALVSRYCSRITMTVFALALTTVLQVITFSRDALSATSFASDVFVAFAASLLIIFLARKGRSAYLTAINQATSDSLTNLMNRRAFIAEVDSEIARQKRYGGIFSLAIIDLDDFKSLNDSMGHTAGDEALRLTSEILQTSTRESDSIGRIGGDEFAILMPNTPDSDCCYIFNQMCVSIASKMAAAGFAVTASVGVKMFQTPPVSTAEALQQADEIMYRAKKSGKNQALNS